MEELENEQYRRSMEYYKDVQGQFAQAEKAMQADIERWYRRLADNNGISYTAAKKLLKDRELEEFHWTVERYIEAGKENALDQRWMKQLENASARYHIDRLEAMKLQVRQHAELLFKEFEGGMGDFLHAGCEEQFYRTAWEVAKGTGVGFSLARLDTRRIDALIRRPWAQDGKVFSDRIWSNKEKLVNALHTELAQCIIRGDAPMKAIARLAKKMGTGKAQAGTLIMTEAAAIASASQKECFRELGVEKYEFDATLDGDTCDVCAGMDGQVFPMSQYEIGVTAPPVHPRCRCCTLPGFDDWEEYGINMERAARDPESGKTVYVDGNLNYAEWKERFVNIDLDLKTAEAKSEKRILSQDEVIAQAKLYGKELENNLELLKYDNGYPISNYLNEKLGYDKRPIVVSASQFEKLSQSKNILYRGVTDCNGISAHDMVEQFKTGKFYCGRGIYGYGTYADTDKSVADYYAYDSGITANGEVMEMLLSDDAKTVDFLEIFAEYEKTGIPQIIGDKAESYQDVLDNVGAYASIKGYDAILLNGFQNKNHVVILNRGKVIIKG